MKSAVLVLASFALSVAASGQVPAPSPGSPVVHEKRDDKGRLINRFTFRADGTVTHRAVAYGLESETLTVEEDLDTKREPVRRFREQVDRRGRPVEREEMTMVGGRKITRQTKFKYDAKGRQTAQTVVSE